MLDRASKLRLRRKMRMHRHQIGEISAQTEDHFDKHFFRRLDRLVNVRRFAATWIALIVLLVGGVIAQTYALSGHYQVLKPAAGGTYTEGVVGAFTNANPVYATSMADRTVSKLIFSGLLTYDTTNNLVGDLAESWQVDEQSRVYTVKLRNNLQWHDGKPLTSADVLFTYSVIQHPDARSPLNASWQGVKVEAPDKQTVVFTLSNPLASFAYSLTNGIIPKHLLEGIPMTDLRGDSFNSARPIGSGPFVWRALQVSGSSPETREEYVALDANEKYHFGQPKLDMFAVRMFRNENRMIDSFEKRELHGMAGLQVHKDNIKPKSHPHYFSQAAAMMTFFKVSEGVLADKTVRQALVRATDSKSIRDQLDYPARAVDGPFLKGQPGYNAELTQAAFNKAEAIQLLENAGWTVDPEDKVRQKDGQKLEFGLYAENTSEAARVTRTLQRQWREIGVNARVELQTANDLQTTLSQHSYDALLRGIAIGADPDVFVYWHSSQKDVLSGSRLNFSEYSSDIADEALSSGRTRVAMELRLAKYKPFLEAWREDAPAVGLYQPSFLYITREQVYGLETHEINNASDRLANVHEWMIRRVSTTVD